MTATIPFVHIATAIARPTGVARIHKHQCDTSPLRLVDQELSQLSETPIMLLAALLGSNRHPIANPCQVFQSNRGLRVFGMRDKLLGNSVVHVALKPGLFTCQFFQTTFRTLDMSSLVSLAMSHASLTYDLNRVASIMVPIRVRGDINNAEINPEKTRRFFDMLST